MDNSKWTFLQGFTPQFQAVASDLEAKLEAVKLAPSATAENLNEISVLLTKASRMLVDAAGSIPTYDQRQREMQLKGFEKAIESLRASSAPKSKFAFKRKAATPKPASPPATPPSQIVVQADVITAASASSTSSSSNLVLSAHSDKYITRSDLPEHTQATDLSISDLKNCVVDLLPPSDNANGSIDISALHVRNLSDCVILLPVIAGSALLHDIRHCTIVLGCHQFRMHSSKGIDVFLDISSHPIIEHCSHIRFSQYPDAFKPSTDSKQDAIIVQDFSHIRSTPSPNHSSLDREVKSRVESNLECLRDSKSSPPDLSTVLPPE